MNLTELLEEENYVLIKQNQYLNFDTIQLLQDRILLLYPQLTSNEFSQICQNLVDCLSSLISIYKIIPSTIKQIGVESVVHGKREMFYFAITKIENKMINNTNGEKKYEVEFDLDKCFMII
jgi:regulator of sigma D